MNLVTGKGHHVHSRILEVYVNMSDRLHRVGEEEHSIFMSYRAKLLYRLNRTYFVVGRHYRGKHGVRTYRGLEILGADDAVFIYIKQSYFKALFFKRAESVKHGGVFYFGGNNVLSFFLVCFGCALYGPVVAFAAAAREIYLIRKAVKHGGNSRARIVKRFFRVPAF
ncbi:hypothetical protein SDC9_140610 [bioreactor metagenome]|uniref:Uncharacterized protein n=1 Tax=bioreactor metagenome TaxID=1076179 RepID=A0A645DY02_9ZZZZ